MLRQVLWRFVFMQTSRCCLQSRLPGVLIWRGRAHGGRSPSVADAAAEVAQENIRRVWPPQAIGVARQQGQPMITWIRAAWLILASIWLCASASAAQDLSTSQADDKGATMAIAVAGRTTANLATSFPADRTGLEAEPARDLQGRLQARIDMQWQRSTQGLGIGAVAAVDVLDGTLLGRPLRVGDKLPGDRFDALQWNDAYLFARNGDTLQARAGVMTSHWGMGLVANDGRGELSLQRQGWFEQHRGGDRALRVLLTARPWANSQGILRGLALGLAGDRVLADDVLPSDDGKASQVMVVARFFAHKQRSCGLYFVRRIQDTSDARRTMADVLDLACDLDWRDATTGDGSRLELEAAAIGGHTDLGATPDHLRHELGQLAAAARYSWRTGTLGLQLDAGYFSGDARPDDGTLTAFRADRNFRQGLVLFERVLAWQSGRMRANAFDPDLTGQAPLDLDRLASDGAVGNAITFFPKAGWRLSERVEFYGGLLFAFAPAPIADPFQTRVTGGGVPVNPLGGQVKAGSLLGTELDVGARWTLRLPDAWKAALQAGVEGGVLFPGGALSGPGEPMGPVQATRVTLAIVGL
jgi:hypothetical protein